MTTPQAITLAVVLFAALGLDLWMRRDLAELRRELERHQRGRAIRARVLAELSRRAVQP